MSVRLCGGNHKAEQYPHKRKFSLVMDTTISDTKEKLLYVNRKRLDYSKSQWKWPTIWRPAQSVNGITNIVKYHHTRGTLTPENLLELDPRKDQLGMGCKQILPDSKTKVWVDEQNRINTERHLAMINHMKRLGILCTQILKLVLSLLLYICYVKLYSQTSRHHSISLKILISSS